MTESAENFMSHPVTKEFLEKILVLTEQKTIEWLELQQKLLRAEENVPFLENYVNDLERLLEGKHIEANNIYDRHCDMIDTLMQKLCDKEEQLKGVSEASLNGPDFVDTVCTNDVLVLLKKKISDVEIKIENSQRTQSDDKLIDLKNTIEQSKTDLLNLWKTCHCSSDIQNHFPLIYTQDYTSENLNFFNIEIRKWQDYYNTHRHLIETVDQYNYCVDLTIQKILNQENIGNLPSEIKAIKEKLIDLCSKNENNFQFFSFGTSISGLIKQQTKKLQLMETKSVPSKKNFIEINKRKVMKQNINNNNKPTKKLPKFKINNCHSYLSAKTFNKMSIKNDTIIEISEDDCWENFENDVISKNVPRSSSFHTPG